MAYEKARLIAGLFRSMSIHPFAANGVSTAGLWDFQDRSTRKLKGLNSARPFNFGAIETLSRFAIEDFPTSSVIKVATSRNFSWVLCGIARSSASVRLWMR
ncbi:MAG: hypothetical protein ABSG62_15385 [Terracidiphilus sp.]|jgi:hypothetical protein